MNGLINYYIYFIRLIKLFDINLSVRREKKSHRLNKFNKIYVVNFKANSICLTKIYLYYFGFKLI